MAEDDTSRIVVVEAPRPETREQEDAVLVRAFHGALSEIADILHLPGSPDLTTDVVEAVRRVVRGRVPAPHPALPWIVDGLRRRGWRIAFAESCTGGRLAADLTTVSGSSDVVAGSAVCYQIDAKRRVLDLDVDETTVVSDQTARRMARAAMRIFGAQVGVSSTGYLDGPCREAYWAVAWRPGVLGQDDFTSCCHHVTFGDNPRHENRERLVASVFTSIATMFDFADSAPMEVPGR